MSAISDRDKQVAKAILAGHKAGISEAQALERAGLLLTDARRREISSQTLLAVAQLIEETPVHVLVPQGRGYAGNDVKRSIVEFIENIVEEGTP